MDDCMLSFEFDHLIVQRKPDTRQMGPASCEKDERVHFGLSMPTSPPCNPSIWVCRVFRIIHPAAHFLSSLFALYDTGRRTVCNSALRNWIWYKEKMLVSPYPVNRRTIARSARCSTALWRAAKDVLRAVSWHTALRWVRVHVYAQTHMTYELVHTCARNVRVHIHTCTQSCA